MNRRIARLEFDVLWLAVRLYGFGASLEVGPSPRYAGDTRTWETRASVQAASEQTAVDTMARGPVGVEHALRELKRSLAVEYRRSEKSRRWLGLPSRRQSTKNRAVPSEGRA